MNSPSFTSQNVPFPPALLDGLLDFSSVPAEMRALPNWVMWRLKPRADGGKGTKIPVQVNGLNASTTTPATWTTFENALQALATGHFSGLGFVLTGTPFCGTDLDNCRNPVTGEVTKFAMDCIIASGSYTELSPSGTGYKIIVRGSLPAAVKKPHIEIYPGNSTSRYFTVTGLHLEGTPETINPCDVAAIRERFVPESPTERKGPSAATTQYEQLADAIAAKHDGNHFFHFEKRLGLKLKGPGKNIRCPFKKFKSMHWEHGDEENFGVMREDLRHVVCLGASGFGRHSWDAISAVFDWDNALDLAAGRPPRYKHMHDAAMQLCREENLTYEDFFPFGKKDSELSLPTLPAPPAPETMTEDEIEAESDKEFPRTLLKAPAGPTWDDAVLYGRAGELTKVMSEYNEGHPAGIYLNLLVSLGNAFGRGPSFRISSTVHYTTEFLANVGETSHGRKGSGRDAVNAFMRCLDPRWSEKCVKSGFGSSESIVYQIRDEQEHSYTIKERHKAPKYETRTVPGVSDKRLCITESELSGLFSMASKPNSLTSAILRNAWDSNPLNNEVKGQNAQGINLSARCKEPHISITGDITVEELRKSLPPGSENNGFGNRFLYCYVYRTKMCSNGGPKIDWSAHLDHFRKVVEAAREIMDLPFSSASGKVWFRMYEKLDGSTRHGYAAKMISRGAAHVRRLAMILALIDLSETIETEHLHAALAIWEYCEESALYIFNGMTSEQSKLLKWVCGNGPVTVSKIREDFYQRNKKVDWIETQLLDLVRLKKLGTDGETFGGVQ